MTKIIGLTGGIGSGKSTVSSYLQEKGFKIIDADKIAHQITEKGSPCLENLRKAFGNEILFEDGSLNRKKLGSIAFSSDENKKILENLTTKVVVEKIREEIKKYKDEDVEEKVILDAPILFETGLDQDSDKIILVTAKEEVRIKRVAKRDGLSEEDIKNRIKHQLNEDEKRKKSDFILDNSENIDTLYKNIDNLLERI